MNNTSLQQSLIEIEQNLKNLASARDQVGSVAEASQNLVEQISSVAKKFEKLEKDFLDDRKDYYSKLGAELIRFQDNLESSSKNAIKISSNLNENQGVEIKKSIEKVSQFLESLKSAREKFDSIDFDQKFAPLRTSFLEFEQQIISQNKIIEFQQGDLKVFQESQKIKEEKLNQKINSYDFDQRFARILDSILGYEKQLKYQNKVMESQQGELKVFQEGQKLKEEKLYNKLDSFDFSRKFSRILEYHLELEKELKIQNEAIESQRVNFMVFMDQQLIKEEQLNAKMESQYTEIKSSNQITQIIIVVATIFIAMLILLF